MIEIKAISIIFASGHYKIEATIEYDLIEGQPELVLIPINGIQWDIDSPERIVEKILDKVKVTIAELRKVHMPTMKLVWEELVKVGLVIE